MTRSVTALNMNSIAFKVAATFAQLNLTKRFTFFPSDQDLKALPEAACLLRAIVDFFAGCAPEASQDLEENAGPCISRIGK